MIIDGRAITAEILSSVRRRVEPLGREVVVRAVVVQPNAATESYLRVKATRAQEAGMRLEVVRLSDDATTEDVLAAVTAPGADAVIVQLPLPTHIKGSLVLDGIPLSKDADVLSSAAYEKFTNHVAGAVLPPVVAAVKEVLERNGIDVKGKRAVVVGSGRLVGQPAAVWLRAEGADVSVVTRDSYKTDEGHTKLNPLASADIIVSGAGSPHFLTPDMLKQGVVLIDAGTSESSGAIVGDAHPDCASVASVFTPVPGGMGPIAVACLFKNAADLALQ